MKRPLELQPPTMDEFKDFVRRVISAPKREVEQKLAELHRVNKRRRHRAAHQ